MKCLHHYLHFPLLLGLLAFALLCSSGDKKKNPAPGDKTGTSETSTAGAEKKSDQAEEPAAVGTAEGSPKDVAAMSDPKPDRVVAPGVAVNNVHYIVGDIPITSFDIAEMKAELAKMKKKKRRGRRGRRAQRAQAEKEAVDTLIVRAILNREARRESIIISDARIDHEIEKRRSVAGMRDEKKFRREVQKQTGMPYDIWRKNLRFQLIRRQLIQIKLAVPAPNEKEVRKFYKKNKRKLGIEIRFREIVLQPKNRSLEEEQRISTLARQIWREVSGNPSRFGFVARKLRENRSRRRFAGGLYDYMPVQEVAERDRLLAGALYGLRPGKVSQVFRNRRNQYFIVKLEGKRSVPFEKVEDGIRQRLYVEKEQEVFESWIEERRKEITITKVK